MKKYIATSDPDGSMTIHKQIRNDLYTRANIQELLDLLNIPPTPTPSSGIQWLKPGELGKVDGKCYLVWRKGQIYFMRWRAYAGPDGGWELSDVTAWAEITPPAWEGEKA